MMTDELGLALNSEEAEFLLSIGFAELVIVDGVKALEVSKDARRNLQLFIEQERRKQ